MIFDKPSDNSEVEFKEIKGSCTILTAKGEPKVSQYKVCLDIDNSDSYHIYQFCKNEGKHKKNQNKFDNF